MLKLLRVILVYTWFLGASAVLMVFFIFRPFNIKNAVLFCRVVPPIARKILGINLEVRNHQKMFDTHPCIFIANHQHALDVPLFGEILLVPTTSLGKKQVLFIPFFGILYWLSGQILIDRKNKERAIASVEAARKAMGEDKISVWIFPEGTRSRGKGLGPFKKGAFHLSLQTNKPLLPIVANSYLTTVDLNKWNSGKVIFNILDPIYPANFSQKTLEEFISYTHEKISNEIKKLDSEPK